ncbi:MAG: hypothetical protein AAGA99_20680 [Actinomycetota bacterium]
MHAFEQIGDRMFVGGAFTDVTARPWDGAQQFDQAFLAAFDVDTGNFIQSWRPTLDDAVWSLTSHNGTLLVGGEFDTVNGTAREGLVALDPQSGAIVSSFVASIANDGSGFEASVRELEVVGDQLYVVGDFNRLVEPPFRHGRFRNARVDAATGKLDKSWNPVVQQGPVFSLAVDESRSQIILVGSFASVNSSPNTGSIAVVRESDGSTVSGYPAQLNGDWDDTYAAVVDGNRYWIAGEQHYLQIRNANNWNWLGCVATGFRSLNETNCTGSWRGGDGFGGDYQVAARLADDVLIFGCHCRGVYYNSISGNTTDLDDRGGVRMYRSNGFEWDWFPELRFWTEGPYAVTADTNGCVWLGGDYTGNVDGFGRFCPIVSPVGDLTAQMGGNGIELSWDQPTQTGPGIARYEVVRDGTTIGTTNSRSFVDGSVSPNTTYTYSVVAVPNGASSGQDSAPVTITAGTPLPPFGTPGNVTLSTNDVDQVTIEWDQVADVRGYLIHRDFQFVRFVPAGTSSFVDSGLTRGETYRYQVRAQRQDGTNSSPSPTQSIQVGEVDDGLPPFGTPANVTLSSNGVDEVTVGWERVSDAIGYLVHRDFQFVAFLPASAGSYVDDGLVQGQTYRYQVRAQAQDRSYSPPSPTQSIRVGADDNTPPSTPVAAASLSGPTEATVTWDPAVDDVGVTGYLIHRNWQFLAYVPAANGTTFVDAGLDPGTRYRYQVRAQDAAGNISPPTGLLVVNTP